MNSPSLVLASIPSPSQGVWHLGPFPVRAYALCIILGIIVCLAVSERRWVARGGLPGTIGEVATWAVPFGLVGGRVYHVITDPELYFSHEHWNPVGALEIWNGGLGIWGAVILGGVGAWIGCRRRGIKLPPLADAIAPGIVIAQAIGRWGNYFNQELYGKSSNLPWAIHITRGDAGNGNFQPTFLYESLWDLGVAAVVIWADKRWKLGHGRAFAVYVAAYTVGRGWIEYLRVDDVNHFLGLRLNDWTSLILFVGAVSYLVLTRHLTREPVVDHAPGETLDEAATAYETGVVTTPDAGPSTPTDEPDEPDEADEAEVSANAEREP
ncbi:prolipoprotein diacylglyceryl transferase [Acidothermaceae bacterium B102]|nr:prolipoprotein diacylglyceryl transferase [Acidothermaceae bacterium B102]